MVRLPGVFAPISDSRMLADHVAAGAAPGVSVLDMCTGSGIVGVTAASRGAAVTVVDVSRRALASARINAGLRGLSVSSRRGNLFGAVPGRRFDLIASNPPYVPSPSAAVPTHGASRAWAAGLDGRAVLDEICDRAATHLRPGGALLLVHSSIIGEDETVRRLRRGGFADVTVVERHTGPLGPLMREQRSLGTIPTGIEEEDVLVFRAEAAR